MLSFWNNVVMWLVVLSQVALHQMQKVCRKRQNKIPCSIVSMNVAVLEQCGDVVGCTKSAATSCCLVCIKSKRGYLRTTNCATAASWARAGVCKKGYFIRE
jgi:hypothetical protein